MTVFKPTTCYCGTCASCTTTSTVPRPAVADPIEWRHGAVKRRLLESIASTEIDDDRPLEAFTTREDDDPAIALIDAFSASLHVLAWNAARLSDGGSILRTDDRAALVDLAGLLGYVPRPTLSATTTLVFTADKAEPGVPARTVPKATKVASVPVKQELPQVFETDADLEVRPEWNELKPVLDTVLPNVDDPKSEIAVGDLSMQVRVGDVVVIYRTKHASIPNAVCGRVSSVVRKPDTLPPESTPSRTVITLASQTPLAGAGNAAIAAYVNRVVILGDRAAPFGVNAPGTKAIPLAKKQPAKKPAKKKPPISLTPHAIDLDAVHPGAVAGALALFERDAGRALARVSDVKELTQTTTKLSAKVTNIVVDSVDLDKEGYKGSDTAIYLETGRYDLMPSDVDKQLPQPSSPDRITVQGKVSLPVGRLVVLSGEKWTGNAGETGELAAEIATVKSCAPNGNNTNNTDIQFDHPISTGFRSVKLVLRANAVGASHGETPSKPDELLGSSKATVAFPRFALKRAPLTCVPSTNPRGYEPALEARVGSRRYDRVGTLFGLDEGQRAYAVRWLRDGGTELQFAGRLPSGVNNVVATYRSGGGLGGNLTAQRITTMMSPISGVSAAVNPVPAEGGSDAESIEDMRTSAPQSVRTLDRVVSLADYEAFARTRRGVGKALATELQSGMRSIVCLTIATTTLDPPVPGSDIVQSLRDALVLASAPGRAVRIEGFAKLVAKVTVGLVVDPAFRRADVEAAARAALAARFGPAQRGFGEALPRSAILAALQSVEGVVAARITELSLPNGPAETYGRLPCPVPRIENGAFAPAGLLSIDADAVKFEEMKP
jgi:hypothetical protein